MKILLAIDGSPCSDAAIEEVARRPWPSDTQVRIISIAEQPAPLTAGPYMATTGYFEEAARLVKQHAQRAVE